MKRKEVEDVIGGKEAWENVDRADGESLVFFGVGFGVRGLGEGGERGGGWGKGMGEGGRGMGIGELG